MAEIDPKVLVTSLITLIESMQHQLEMAKHLMAGIANVVLDESQEDPLVKACGHCGTPIDEALDATCFGGPPTYSCASCGKFSQFPEASIPNA